MKSDCKAVIFDMDGVIIDSEVLVLKLWSELEKKYAIPTLVETAKKCIGISMDASREIFKQTYGEDVPYDQMREDMRSLFGGRIPDPKPGVRELFDAIKAHQLPMALATSTRLVTVERELKGLGLYDYFDAIVTREMVEKGKPAPDIYLKACEALSVDPADAYGIEDSRNGIFSIASAGMHPILVPDMVPLDDEMRAAAEAVLPSLIEVRDYLFL